MSAHSTGTWWRGMAAAVLAHFGISMVHGAAHGGAQVPLSPPATLFVFAVILAGPLAGLALSWRAPRPGSAVVGLTMAGSLVFGVVNHFVLDGADHVGHIDAQWRLLFSTTAALLAITEAAGLGCAMRLVREGARA